MTHRRRQVAHVLFAAALLFVGVAVVLPASPTSALATDGSFTGSVTANRTFVDQDGNESVASTHKVNLHVSQTQDLRGRQEVHVTWDGAVPTGGVVADPNSSDGRNQEYPFVLLQCRGVDGKVPKGQVAVSPETCWTQTSTERYIAATTSIPAWRFDAYESPANRGPVVGAPDPLPEECSTVTSPTSARWLPFRAAGGEVYYGGPDPGVGCAPLAPESDSVESGGLPSNTTYGITGTDGKGEADFAVWTAAENASLGCSVEVACSLVAVPIVGVSCDAWGTKLPADQPQVTKAGVPLTPTQLTSADTTCRRTGSYQPGESKSSQTSDQAVRGNLWWSASNWRNRITVPLTFAATGSVCDAISQESPLELMGSVVLNELTASWRPKFCTTKGLFTFTHVQQADSLARNLVNAGEIDGAFSSAPVEGGFARPVVQAPIAFGGFAIAFSIDDTNRQRRESLNLNARLVAKLLTSSYPAASVVKDNHAGFADNPMNITQDPEFQALNPGLPVTSNLEAAAALQVFSSSSDLVWALTSWINSDPEARAWLDGTPDPWGMKVNESYQGIKLPLDNWPLRDDFMAPQWYQDQNACYAKSPTPFMQLIANPPSSLSTVVLNMQFSNSAVATVCRYDGYDPTTLPLKQQGRQSVGYRFVLGLVSLSAASRYNLRTAALQTTAANVAGQTYTVAGRTFVAPDEAGLQAAAKLLTADKEAGTWKLDYSKLSTPAGRSAYPGALPVYAVIPTSGLDEHTSTNVAKFLCYASDEGQVSGKANGQLPAGYLPLTEANGLGAEHDYLLTSVAAVRRQGGDKPALDIAAPTKEEACDFSEPAPTSSPKPSDSPSTSIPDPGAAGPAVPAVSVPTAADPSGAPSGSATPPVSDAPTVLTAGEESTFGRVGVPGLLIVALACALAGILIRWSDPITAAVAAAGPQARKVARGGRRRR